MNTQKEPINNKQQQQQQLPLSEREKVEKLIEGLKATNLTDLDTVDKAFNNLIVLARQYNPAVVFSHPDCLAIISETIDKNKTQPNGAQVIISCFRLLSELAKSSANRSLAILNRFSIDTLIDYISFSNDNELMTSFQYMIQTIIETLAGVQEMKEKLKIQAKLDKERTLSVGEAISTKVPQKVDREITSRHRDILFNIIVRLIKRASSYIITPNSRDCLLAIAMSNIDYNGLNFGVDLVNEGCISSLLDIASEVEDIKGPSSMDLTPMTHSLISAILDRMYGCHDNDQVRETFRENVQQFLDSKLRNPDIDDKIRVAKLFTVLLAGPAEIGNSCIGQTGMIEMILTMASSNEFSLQKAALDAIIAIASKKDKCTALATSGEKILNELRESNNEEIRLRALMGLSKISSIGSTDASVRPFSAEANISFANDCRVILKRPTPEYKLKQYAIESLAYLSFDGDVKEDLVNDDASLEALFETILHDTNSPVVYSILNIFVNLTNSYNKQETAPELIELAKFAQQHIPEEHPKDKVDVLVKRLEHLAMSNLVPTLVKLVNIESKAAKELIARIIHALSEIEDIRGRIIQQGAVKLLMSIAQGEQRPPEQAYILAAHALARLSITINPEFVFQGQRLVAVIKPLKMLLKPECKALQNFEGLMALTNIAQANETTRAHLLHDNGFSLIEACMFEEHEMIRRAAVQCLVNIIHEPQVVALYEADNDRVKYLVILCQEDDLETIKAASGALATLFQISEKACERIFTAKQWLETLILLLSNENIELVHRAVVIVNSIVRCGNQSLAERVFETKLFEILVALTLPQVTTIPEPVKRLAQATLKLGKQRKLIKENPNSAGQLAHIDESEDEDQS